MVSATRGSVVHRLTSRVNRRLAHSSVRARSTAASYAAAPAPSASRGAATAVDTGSVIEASERGSPWYADEPRADLATSLTSRHTACRGAGVRPRSGLRIARGGLHREDLVEAP